MPVIAVSSPKGGVGKTTTSLVLATELAHRGIPVTIIDTDANQSVLRWSRLAPVPAGITVITDVNEKTIVSTIREVDREDGIVIVDLEGIASRLNSRAMAVADLVLIVTKAAAIDADMAHRAVEMIHEEEEVLDREVPHCVVFTQTAAAVLTREARFVIDTVRSTDIDVVMPFLSNRSHYSLLHNDGGGLRDLNPHPSLGKAIDEAERFATAIYERVKKSIASMNQDETEVDEDAEDAAKVA
jgi:chromosome partitioning protein